MSCICVRSYLGHHGVQGSCCYITATPNTKSQPIVVVNQVHASIGWVVVLRSLDSTRLLNHKLWLGAKQRNSLEHRTAEITCDASYEVKSYHQLPQIAPGSLASPSVSPVSLALLGMPFSSGLVADFANDCTKSAMMSSMCSVPTEIRIKSSVTPLLMRSSSESCSCVVVHG
jgi:hypothetical protein